ncbi:MAG: hypothetical protein HC875_09720 [Anaerolineales bacterium]|nr:hypothetical protein [Anaerolineales bacterium]
MSIRNHSFLFFSDNLSNKLLPMGYELMPNVSDIFELEFALGEINLLVEDELIERSAFIGKVNGVPTRHYKLGLASSLDIYNNKSIRTRSFFQKGRFSTGYGVHSLFPYRGKFHAQLVKAIINIIGLKPGDTLLDPMMGSGTACIEAQTMGINAIGVDISPFCKLMASAKSIALTTEPTMLDRAVENPHEAAQALARYVGKTEELEKFSGHRKIVLLAYLDAMGYARRVKDQAVGDKFPEVLSRYKHTINEFARLRQELGLDLGQARFEIGNTCNLTLEDESIDGIITSPPYSFAIDYIENDLPQLEYLGVNVENLRKNLMGLRGGNKKKDRIETYFSDLKLALAEMSRVLRTGKYCVIVIGSNEIQTGGIRHEVEIKNIAPTYRLKLVKEMIKPIRGIRNSMTEEFVLFFQKET